MKTTEPRKTNSYFTTVWVGFYKRGRKPLPLPAEFKRRLEVEGVTEGGKRFEEVYGSQGKLLGFGVVVSRRSDEDPYPTDGAIEAAELLISLVQAGLNQHQISATAEVCTCTEAL